MAKLFLLGNEACALGAIDAGCTFAFGYPGTPSTEIMEYLLRYREDHPDITARWCTNEKTAFEGAMGVSYAGRRALVVMKHVGLNVAADAFINAVLQKINGGLVVVVADDPGMHSSQNEQDTRFLADFAKTVCFEPGSQQETYTMMREAFSVSGKFGIAVVLRMVTRLSHARAVVIRGGAERASEKPCPARDRGEWICLPSFARLNYRRLLDRQQQFREYTCRSSCNQLALNPSFKSFGVITAGIAGGYYRETAESLPVQPSHLHVGVYPFPGELVRQLADSVDTVIVIEEGYPFIEEKIRSAVRDPLVIRGKMDGSFPDQGELHPDHIRNALALPYAGKTTGHTSEPLPARFSRLCKGCPHNDSFEVLRGALKIFEDTIVTSDIGCYTLGALPPYDLIDCALCMGASIGMARGAAEAGCANVVALIGDSSLLHSGIPGIIDAVAADTPMTVLVLDNGTVAMTGGQDPVLPSARLLPLLEGIGVRREHCRTIVPLPANFEKNVAILREEMSYRGLSVILARRSCVRRRKAGSDGVVGHDD